MEHKSFDDFMAWSVAHKMDDEIAAGTGELVAEAVKSGELKALDEAQVKAVYQVAVLVAGNITYAMLESYHRWLAEQGGA